MTQLADSHVAPGPVLEELTVSDCLRLLGDNRLGRVAVSLRALPHIFPVNYVLDGTGVVFVSGRGTKLAAASRNAVVAFEIDGTDNMSHTGWSVEVTGTSEIVTDPIEVEHCRRLALSAWARPEDGCFVRIQIVGLTGRRVTYATSEAI